jgi:hypothetical protein
MAKIEIILPDALKKEIERMPNRQEVTANESIIWAIAEILGKQ